jgi:hypothetical protein
MAVFYWNAKNGIAACDAKNKPVFPMLFKGWVFCELSDTGCGKSFKAHAAACAPARGVSSR